MSEFTTAVFDPALNLSDTLLVEASAGTGKTYNIQNIYLRLILQTGLTVQQLLVVTFTEAATKELRDRLRAVLLQCRYELESPSAATEQRIRDAIALANPTHDTATAKILKKRIQVALLDFDAAAIFTIHGFCKRVLDRYAFECGHDSSTEVVPDESAAIREVCRDWWRQQVYAKDEKNLPFGSPDDLIGLVTEVYKRPRAILQTTELPLSDDFLKFLDACDLLWAQIIALRGDFWWENNSICRKNKPPISIVSLQSIAAPHSAQWQTHLNNCVTPFGKAVIEVLTTLADIPQGGNSYSFAQSIQTISKNNAARNSLTNPKLPILLALCASIRARRKTDATLTYDSMLLDVCAALQDTEAGPHLRELLRGEFRAALIDEFQDTDPTQFDIFHKIFSPSEDPAEERLPLVFVGDPKQAIYGFRGGDIFAYYKAKQSLPPTSLHSLGTNYRSEKNLVAAINEMFRDADGNRTFLNEHIPYSSDLLANDVGTPKELLVNGARDPQPLKIVSLQDNRTGEFPAFVASEIVKILSDPTQTLGGQRIQPRDIAVLVMKHEEANEIQQTLLAAGVNATRQANGNIFMSDMVTPLVHVMRAMLEPGRASLIRVALGCGLLPCSPAQLARYHSGTELSADAHFEDWVADFRAAGESWNKSSFMAGFRTLAHKRGLFEHVAQQSDGHRKLADLRHLVELAHQAARSMRLGPVALTTWLQQPQDLDDDDTKLRISDDTPAVQIMTVFASKGLQFPIVFLPTQWLAKSKFKSKGYLTYHRNDQFIFDLGTSSAAATAEREVHEESIRKMYVAMTRAINRTVVFESKANTNGSIFSLAHLLNRLPLEPPPAHIFRGEIALDDPPTRWTGDAQPAPEDLLEREKPPMDATHGHTSFSGLSPHESAKPTAEPEAKDDDPNEPDDGETKPKDIPPIFQISGGKKTGNCWHQIFENLDFAGSHPTSGSTPKTENCVNDTLDAFGMCPVSPDAPVNPQRDAVHEMVQNTLSVPLQACNADVPFCLRELPPAQCRKELEFNFSLHRKSDHFVTTIGDILDTHWRTPARDEHFIAALKAHNKPIPKGFMTGFIDLVFQHGGRFYIADWKSNQIGKDFANFDDKGLAAEMAAHSYYLQYLIYSVALHGFLSSRLDNYDFDTHFGGVFYFFLRGIDGKSKRGVFSDKPSKALVSALSEFLGGPS